MAFISPVFTPYMQRWHLQADGTTLRTHSSRVLPVIAGKTPAILKVALEDDEKHACILMRWWNGEGAAKVLAAEGDALLLERATGTGSLSQLARNGGDGEATEILCRTLGILHTHSTHRTHPEGLMPLQKWFAPLQPAAAYYRGTLVDCSRLADALLRQQTDVVALHGDLHHGNVLDFGQRGWLAVDPKYLRGERTYDYAHLFCGHCAKDALHPGCFQKRLNIVARAAGLSRERLLRWIAAYAGLCAARHLEDDNLVAAQADLEVAKLALAEMEI